MQTQPIYVEQAPIYFSEEHLHARQRKLAELAETFERAYAERFLAVQHQRRDWQHVNFAANPLSLAVDLALTGAQP